MANSRWSLLVLGLLSLALICLAIAPLVCDSEPPSPKGLLVGGLRVPEGYVPKEGTTAEPYTNTGWAKEIVHEATGIELVFIPAGEFVMGESKAELIKSLGVFDNAPVESTLHPVRLTKPFYIGKYEVTQGQWNKVMGTKPFYRGTTVADMEGGYRRWRVVEATDGDDQLPLEHVSWNVCHEFLKKAGGGLRLPTEAQWEYACRAGTTTRFNTGETLSPTDANYDSSTDPGLSGTHLTVKTKPVGSFKPNAWGLYDMHGNVSEWCQDEYGEYPKGPAVDPLSIATWSKRVHRGGGYADPVDPCGSGSRALCDADAPLPFGGFRVSLPVSP